MLSVASQPLKKLGPAHQAAVRMRIEGTKNAEIAQTLNVTKRQIEVWFSDPLVKAEIERQMVEIERVFQEKMAGAGLVAISALQEVAGADIPVDDGVVVHQKLDAANSLLDRIGMTSKVSDRRPVIEGDTTNIQALIAGKSDSELANLLHSWATGASRPSDTIEATATER